MNQENHTITEVFGSAEVVRPSESVRVRATVRHVDDKSDAARKAARAVMEKLYIEVRALQKDGLRLAEEGLRSSYSIEPIYRHRDDMRAKAGYAAEFVLTVESPDVDRARDIFERLARVRDCAVESPTFHLTESTTQAMRNEAFIRAARAAQGRFNFQCQAFGFDPNDYTIVGWRYNRGSVHHGSGKRLHIHNDHVTVVGGTATISATVHVTYA